MQFAGRIESQEHYGYRHSLKIFCDDVAVCGCATGLSSALHVPRSLENETLLTCLTGFLPLRMSQHQFSL